MYLLTWLLSLAYFSENIKTGMMNGLLLEQSLSDKINLEEAVERVIAVLETESQ